MPGKLIVIATPIGNLDDLSGRAIESLRTIDLVACEDTRRTGRLLAHLDCKRKLLSLHDHNERQRLPQLIAALESGKSIALVADAGTPLLSDPGFLLVREAIAKGIEVDHLPGPSAPISALVVSGLPPYPFTFAGFPPPKSGKRRRFLERYASLDHTLVLFESPHRLLATLQDLQQIMGDRRIAIGRELTKKHQEVLRGPVSEVAALLAQRAALKGEFTLVIGAGS